MILGIRVAHANAKAVVSKNFQLSQSLDPDVVVLESRQAGDIFPVVMLVRSKHDSWLSATAHNILRFHKTPL